MSFANSIWLWSLSGLAIPIAIHLLSRKEGKVIPFGSIRHLETSETAQFSSIRLNEIWLLILRCLIIILITLFLSGLNINFIHSKKSNWLVVDPDIENNIPSSTIDSLLKQGYEKHYLTNNFPSDSKKENDRKNNWYLVEQLGKKNIEAIVFSANHTSDFYGSRISKPENIQWITVAQKDTSRIIGAIPINADSVWTRNAKSSLYLNELSTEETANTGLKPDLQNLDSITAAIYFTPEFAHDAKIIHASLLAIKSTFPLRLSIYLNPPESVKADWNFWLSKTSSPHAAINSFSFHELNDENVPLLISKYVAGRRTKSNTTWIFTRRLTQSEAIAEKLPIKLGQILLPKFDKDKYQSSLPDQFTWSSVAGRIPYNSSEDNQLINLILFTSIMTVATLERWLAFRRKI